MKPEHEKARSLERTLFQDLQKLRACKQYCFEIWYHLKQKASGETFNRITEMVIQTYIIFGDTGRSEFYKFLRECSPSRRASKVSWWPSIRCDRCVTFNFLSH